jgi:hypothetical protein
MAPLILTLLSPALLSAGGAFFAGVNYSGAVHPKDFRSPYADGMGYSAGLEQGIAKGYRLVLDLSTSRFLPDPHAFSDGGRKLLIGGGVTSFLVTSNLKAEWSRADQAAYPFVQAGLGLSRFSHAPMDTIDIIQATFTSTSGDSESRMALRAGGGVVVRGPAGSALDAQFDVFANMLAGENPVLYVVARMVILANLP